MTTLDQIRTIDRKVEVPHDGLMCDLLWSDPEDIDGGYVRADGPGRLHLCSAVSVCVHNPGVLYLRVSNRIVPLAPYLPCMALVHNCTRARARAP